MAAIPLTITNPGAETGDTSGWTNDLGTLIVRTSDTGVTPRTGSYYFCSSASDATAKCHQDIAIPSEYHTDIDAGKYIARFLAYQTTYATGYDLGSLGLYALDGSNNQLAYNSTSEFNKRASWDQTVCELILPANTRTLRIELNGQRYAGTQNSCYWDDLALEIEDLSTITPSFPYTLDILNPGAELNSTWESGRAQYWKNVSGTLTIATSAEDDDSTTPVSGTYFFVASAMASHSESYLDVPIPSAFFEAIDEGGIEAIFSIYQIGYSGDDDSGYMGISALDEQLSVLDSNSNSAADPTSWTQRELALELPQYTRYVRMTLYGTRDAGNQLSTYWDDAEITLDEIAAGGGGDIPVLMLIGL